MERQEQIRTRHGNAGQGQVVLEGEGGHLTERSRGSG